ncbi:dihydropteroate synthase [Thalassoglobus sp.]|uniref:dihydropteroate synthase n=1 Tax=Thalassoglobus sp. TaxID=2795869 RepID=UPI003AA86BD8
MQENSSQLRTWTFSNQTWTLGEFPKLMGIVNVTPDSFSDGGDWLAPADAVAHAMQLVEEGADILDVGGESTRPGAEPVPIDEELRRVIPVIEQLASQTDVPISIDTMKSEVAKAALQAGASIINDVSAFEHDPRMTEIAAGCGCGVILMHRQGTPQTMQNNPQYDDVVAEVSEYLFHRTQTLTQLGIAAERIVIDPGIGFGKTAEHNLSLLTHIAELRAHGHSVLIGHSRKRFLSKIIGRPIEERLAGTLGVAIALAQQNTDLIRVHDVAAVKDALLAWKRLAQP